MTAARIAAGLALCLPTACTAPAQFPWPEAVSTSRTTLFAHSTRDPTLPDGLAPERIVLRLLDPEQPFYGALLEQGDTLELALFEAEASKLGLDHELEAVSADKPGAVHLPLARAGQFLSAHMEAGGLGPWVEQTQPPPVLAGSYVVGPPETCSPIEDDPIDLPFAPGIRDESGVNFVARIGLGVALIGTGSAAYRLSDGHLSRWRIEPEPILSARIRAGANYKSAYVPEVGGQVWLGGRSGLLERYDPVARTIVTETASRAELPTWRALEGSPDGSELFAGGVYDDHGSYSIVIGELAREPGPQAVWLPMPLGASDQAVKAVALAYEGPRTALVSRESATLLRYSRGAVTLVPTVWDAPVIYRLARGPDGIFIAAAVGERASFGLLGPEGAFTGLGQAAFPEPYALRPLGRRFVFTGSAGWVGVGGSVVDPPLICGRRLHDNAQQKRAMDTLSDDSFLVGGEAYRSEPSSIYRVRLKLAP